jgi:hypothetical protein
LLAVILQVIEAETGEVANEEIAGQVPILDTGEIVPGLFRSAIQVLAPGFLLNEQNPFPQQINIAVLAVELFNMRFKGGHPPPGNPKDIKEGITKRFAFGLFRDGIGPFMGKLEGAGFNLVPG